MSHFVPVWRQLLLMQLLGVASATSWADEPVARTPRAATTSASPRSIESANETTCIGDSFRVRTYRGGPSSQEVLRQCEQWTVAWLTRWRPEMKRVEFTPPCEIHVHSDRGAYVRSVGRAGMSTKGSSLIRRENDGTWTRRIDLLASPGGELTALAHELVHVLLADEFGGELPPLWLDEGLALQADPSAKRSLHWRDCEQALHSGTSLPLHGLLRLEQLTSPDQFPVVYGQSLALVDFLQHAWPPEKLLPFARLAREKGYEYALREVYELRDFDELETRWRAHVRQRLATSVATSSSLLAPTTVK